MENQSHILWSNTRAIEWFLNHGNRSKGNLNAPLFARDAFCECLRVACTEALAAELMNVSRS